MAELILERFTICPTGKPADERVFEVVLADNDPLPLKDPTVRVTTLARLFTRGDLTVLRGRERDMVLTTGKDLSRTVLLSGRAGAGHLDLDLTALDLKFSLPLQKGGALPCGFYGGPAKGATAPAPATSFDSYKARAVATNA